MRMSTNTHTYTHTGTMRTVGKHTHAPFVAFCAVAQENGVEKLTPLSAAEVAGLEPQVRCVGALLSPSTGIVDSRGLMQALLGSHIRSPWSLALLCVSIVR